MRSNPIAARLRQVVSQDRMRYKDEETGADLDLSYITSSIIGRQRVETHATPSVAMAQPEWAWGVVSGPPSPFLFLSSPSFPFLSLTALLR